MKRRLGSVCIGMYLSSKGLVFVAAAGPIDDPGVLGCNRTTLRTHPFAPARVLQERAARQYLIAVERDVLNQVRTAYEEFTSGITAPGFVVDAAAIPRPAQAARAPLVRILRSERLMRGAEERLTLRACRNAVRGTGLPWLEYDRSHVFSAAAAQAGLTEREFLALIRSRRTLTAGPWSRDLQAACAAALLAGTQVCQPTTM